MYEITTESSFSAAHYLKNYQGPCENLHGHNWRVCVTVRTETLNSIGIGIDFRQLRGYLEKILATLDHANLNEILGDGEMNPSSENIARYIYTELASCLKESGVWPWKVKVYETPGNATAYFETD